MSSMVNDPTMSAVSFDQLIALHEAAEVLFGHNYQGMRMRDIVDLVIKPICAKYKTSYSKFLNPNGLKVDVFVSHAWDGPFAEFVGTIRSIFSNHWVEKPNFFICSFSLIQGTYEEIEEQLGTSLDDAPFVKAIKVSKLFVVVRNLNADLYRRIWCVCEILYAVKLDFYPYKTLVGGPNTFSHLQTSCREAQAYDDRDKEKVFAALTAEYKVAHIDEIVQKFREWKTTPMPKEQPPPTKLARLMYPRPESFRLNSDLFSTWLYWESKNDMTKNEGVTDRVFGNWGIDRESVKAAIGGIYKCLLKSEKIPGVTNSDEIKGSFCGTCYQIRHLGVQGDAYGFYDDFKVEVSPNDIQVYLEKTGLEPVLPAAIEETGIAKDELLSSFKALFEALYLTSCEIGMPRANNGFTNDRGVVFMRRYIIPFLLSDQE